MNATHNKTLRRRQKAVWIGTRWPSFDEFVQYLLDEHRRHAELNMHWTPIAQFCTPCQIRFDIVAKFETLDEDQRYVIARADLGRFIAPQWKNPGKGHKTADVNHKYYHQLSAQQIDGLYEMFRLVFVFVLFIGCEFHFSIGAIFHA